MKKQPKIQADTYLKSGSNELKLLEYTSCGDNYGINILKVSRILSEMPGFRSVPQAHPAVRGVFNEHDKVIPVIDLGYFLDSGYTPLDESYRVIVTEFFGIHNAFLVSGVDMVHTVLWEQVIDAQQVLDFGRNPYIISIVQPTENHMILLLDYETIIMEISPEHLEKHIKKGVKVKIEGKRKKILVAEDSSSIRSMLQLELDERGFEVILARDGKEAFRILGEQDDIAMVITDVEMPAMDGLALTKEIKGNDRTRNIPVLVYSSIGDVGMKERAHYLEAEGHITKLNLDELYMKICEILNSGKN
jgi:two-component system, chemotaxis family, chemotaxis protein CheV